MADFSVIFAGFGGQGVLFMGKVTAYTGLAGGKQVTWMPSYGPEMRGGTANCSVCISDAPVGSPIINEADALVAMSIPSYDKFIGTVKPGGLVVYDSSIFQPEKPRSDVKTFPLPASQLAREENLDGIAGMILLGKMLGETGIADISAIEAALKKSVSQSKTQMIEHNLRAIKLGMRQR